MSPPATSVQSVRRIEGRGCRVDGELRRQPPVGEVFTWPTPKRRFAPAERADLGPTWLGAEEREMLAVRGEVRCERLRVRCEDEVRRRRPAALAEAGEDRVGVRLDELERVVGLARPGEDCRDLLAVVRLGGRPELGHGHDRDGGELRRVAAGVGGRRAARVRTTAGGRLLGDALRRRRGAGRPAASPADRDGDGKQRQKTRQGCDRGRAAATSAASEHRRRWAGDGESTRRTVTEAETGFSGRHAVEESLQQVPRHGR